MNGNMKWKVTMPDWEEMRWAKVRVKLILQTGGVTFPNIFHSRAYMLVTFTCGRELTGFIVANLNGKFDVCNASLWFLPFFLTTRQITCVMRKALYCCYIILCAVSWSFANMLANVVDQMYTMPESSKLALKKIRY